MDSWQGIVVMNKKFVLMLGVGVGAAVALTAVGLWAVTKGEGELQTQVLWQNVPANEQSCITRILQQRGLIPTCLVSCIRSVRMTR